MGDVCRSTLVIQKLKGLEELKAGYTAVKQKTCYREGAAPAVEPIKDRERRKQSAIALNQARRYRMRAVQVLVCFVLSGSESSRNLRDNSWPFAASWRTALSEVPR